MGISGMIEIISMDRIKPSTINFIIIFVFCTSFASYAAECTDNSSNSVSVTQYGYKIINIYPHDSVAFTQGLVYDNGDLYEGTGRYGASTLREVNLTTGTVLRQIRLEDTLFGEGISLWKDRIIQLTWQSGMGLVYDKGNMTKIAGFSYPTEGWGITSDGRRLIMSDGTETLHFLDPETYEEQSRIRVLDGRTAVKGLNELEHVKGDIFANVWPTNLIAIISPETGQVKGWINLEGILQKAPPVRESQYVDVLNGIAYDLDGQRLFVTGKLWPYLFQIELQKQAT
jgi:glutaminyl-peptide cyclotransferase